MGIARGINLSLRNLANFEQCAAKRDGLDNGQKGADSGGQYVGISPSLQQWNLPIYEEPGLGVGLGVDVEGVNGGNCQARLVSGVNLQEEPYHFGLCQVMMEE